MNRWTQRCQALKDAASRRSRPFFLDPSWPILYTILKESKVHCILRVWGMGDLIPRAYKPGDEREILRLYQLAFGRDLDLSYWNWRFRDNPEGKLQIELMFDGNSIAGHYAVSPVRMVCDGKPALTALSNYTMTHPDYGRKGIFTILAERLYDRIVTEGGEFVWGFPNKNSYHGFFHRLNWSWVKDISTLMVKAGEFKSPPWKSRLEAGEVNSFGPEFDVLWMEQRDQYANLFRYFAARDTKYLNWRFVQNPRYPYKIFFAKEGVHYLGYSVVKFYEDEDQVFGDIVDIFCTFDKDVFQFLIGTSVEYLSQKAAKICCWMNEGCVFYGYLRDMGFQESPFLTHFGVRPLSATAQGERAYLTEYKNWYLTMGDSDVY